MGTSHFTYECSVIFFHSRDETSCYFNGNTDGRTFLKCSMLYDESIATCQLFVELSCRLHASNDNLPHLEDQKICTWKSKRDK